MREEEKNLAPNFPFPCLCQIALPDLVVCLVIFPLLIVLFVPRVKTPEMFSEAPICVSMRKEGSLCQFLPIQRQIIVVRIEIMTSVLDPQCEFEQSEQGVEDPSRIQGKLDFWCDLV